MEDDLTGWAFALSDLQQLGLRAGNAGQNPKGERSAGGGSDFVTEQFEVLAHEPF